MTSEKQEKCFGDGPEMSTRESMKFQTAPQNPLLLSLLIYRPGVFESSAVKLPAA
jgi:hypothetical protein